MRSLRETFWRWVALELAASPRLVGWLLRRAQKRPFEHLEGYMNRWWLVEPGSFLNLFLPAMRFHHILRGDSDRHPHDHPWAFRSIILRGHYLEERHFNDELGSSRRIAREVGATYLMPFGAYHRISSVSLGGVLTLCILGKKQDTWGFLVNGQRIQWQEYYGHHETPASLAGDVDMRFAHFLRGGE